MATRDGVADNIIRYEPAKREAPALGMSVVMNMAGDRQATLQCFIASDAPMSEQHALMDLMFSIGDRQKARYELVGLRADLAKQKKVLANMLEDIPRAEKDHVEKQDQLRTDMAKCLKQSEDAIQKGYDAWVQRGKRGSYKPEGSVKGMVDAMDRQVQMHKDQMEKNEAEKAKFLVNIEASAARFRQEITEIEAEIERREALLGA